MQRRTRRLVAQLIVVIAVSLVGSTSAALYLATIGPKACCSSHCHRGAGMPADDAARCCTSHLGTLPSALGPTAASVGHVLMAALPSIPVLLVAPRDALRDTPPASVTGRASPPGSLVAVHTSILA